MILHMIKEVVNLIDNSLCYCLMTAECMMQEVKEAKAAQEVGKNSKSEEAENPDFDLRWFYIIEACYYLNKCTMILMQVRNNLNASVFQERGGDNYTSGKINVARLANIISLMEKMYADINKITDNAANMVNI